LLLTPTDAGIVAANMDNVVLAAQSVATIQTVADNILDVNTNATNIVAIQNASANADEASVSAAAALVSENAAKDSENIVVAKEALMNPHYGNISLVGSDLSNEYTHIDDAGSINDAVAGGTGTSNVKTVADNITNVNLVVGSIANVSTVATDIANINAVGIDVLKGIGTNQVTDSAVLNALTNANQAISSASDAATAQGIAESAKDAALAALDSFDDRYLGQKASDPTLDNDGDALVAGSLYFNTTTDAMMVYEGSVWVAAYASLSGALLTTNNLSDLSSVSAARANLGLVIGSTVQAYDANTMIDDSNFSLDLGGL
jgi:hypothetical protein